MQSPMGLPPRDRARLLWRRPRRRYRPPAARRPHPAGRSPGVAEAPGKGGRPHDVAQDRAGFDRGQLLLVADKDQAGVRADGLE